MKRLPAALVLVASSATMLTVLVLYLLIPLRVTVGMLYPGNWGSIGLALGALAVAECCVVLVLRNTTGRRLQAQSVVQQGMALQPTGPNSRHGLAAAGTLGGEIVIPFPGGTPGTGTGRAGTAAPWHVWRSTAVRTTQHAAVWLARQLRRPLLLIMVVQAIASLSLANSAYQDEALQIFAGKQILHQLLGQPVAVHYDITSLSGFSYLYPVLAGAVNALGGLALVRLCSLVFMLVATAAVYSLTLTFFGRMSARLAAALFAVQGPVLFLGNFATYDAICLSLMALTAVLVMRAAEARQPWLSLALGPMIAVTVLTKYAAALFVPTLLALLAYQSWLSWGWRQVVVRLVLAVSLTLVGTLAIAHVAGHDIMTTLNSAYLQRHVAEPDSRLHLAERVWSLGAAILVLALVGLLIGGRQGRALRVLLLGSALLAPAYHLYLGELVALHKHVAFGMVFAAPLAGAALVRIANYRWLTGIVACLLVLSMGLGASKELYNEWPDTSNLMALLRAQNLPPHSQVLAEPAYEGQYYLDDSKHWNWISLWFFSYRDAAGRESNRVPAYNEAIADGYFDLVVLGYGPGNDTKAVAVQIDSGLRRGTTYELIAKVPYSSAFGKGYWWVWRKRAGAPGTASGSDVTGRPSGQCSTDQHACQPAAVDATPNSATRWDAAWYGGIGLNPNAPGNHAGYKPGTYQAPISLASNQLNRAERPMTADGFTGPTGSNSNAVRMGFATGEPAGLVGGIDHHS